MPKLKSDIGFFFNPKSIAVIGASPTPGKISNVIIESLKRAGFTGGTYPVNPKYKTVGDIKCYGSISEIGKEIDLAVIALPASLVPDALRGAGGMVKGAIIVSGGFKESGKVGISLEEQVRGIVENDGIRVMGPNCMGIYDTISKVDTFFIPADRIGRPKRGGISLLSQSGSFAGTMMDEMAYEGIGVARVISYGNRVDVGEAECLDFLAEDIDTRMVALYVESVDDGRLFVDAAARCAKKKPIVAVKVGKRGSGEAAARSHTGAMTGRYEIYRAAFRKAGIIEVGGYEELKEACKALSIYDPAPGRRVLIISDGGGIGVNLADSCEEQGLEVAGLGRELQNSLSSFLPSFCSVQNPIDLTGSVVDDWYVTALREGLSDDYDMAILALMWGPPQLSERLIDRICYAIKELKKPVIICTPGGEFAKGMNRILGERGVPVFTTPESAARAAAVLARD